MATLRRGAGRESPQLVLEKWRGLQKQWRKLFKTPNAFQRYRSWSLFLQTLSREGQQQKSCVIIADSTTNPRGFPYPLPHVQALTNFCDNINIPDRLCGLLLPNVNRVIVCEPQVNLWAFKAVACQRWHCCPISKQWIRHRCLLGSGTAKRCCQIYLKMVQSQINGTK